VEIVQNVVLVLAVIVALIFSILVLLTGKGDAMSGGGSVRTTYKGKATFDDIISQTTLWFGVAFMALVLVYNVVVNRVAKPSFKSTPEVSSEAPAASSSAPATSNSAPAASSPAPESSSAAPAASSPAPAASSTPTSEKK
jgi:preprotein translocase subunit SecG